MKFSRIALSAIAALSASGEISTLYGALTYLDVSPELQNLASMISGEFASSLTCQAANKIAEVMKSAQSLATVASHMIKETSSTATADWDRILLGLLEVMRMQTNSACQDVRIEPRLCEDLEKIVEIYGRRRVCGEITNSQWKFSRCPGEKSRSEPRGKDAGVTLPFGLPVFTKRSADSTERSAAPVRRPQSEGHSVTTVRWKPKGVEHEEVVHITGGAMADKVEGGPANGRAASASTDRIATSDLKQIDLSFLYDD